MLPYSLLRPLVFSLNPELAHDMSLRALALAGRSCPRKPPLAGRTVSIMGLEFANPVGLAAGLDKNAQAIDGLALWGFGFIEVGTVTPRPQAGNPRPRLFRLPHAHAIINRMGFNNAGVDALVKNCQRARYRGILGINIGKNATTPIDNAASDYLAALQAVYAHASYIAINISSPNTENLRSLQSDDALEHLLATLTRERDELAQQHGSRKPLVLKVAPDLDELQIQAIADALRRHRIDGLIATNTTLSRQHVAMQPHADEAGGLSGAPLFEAATAIVARFAHALAGEVPIIAAGGIMSGEQAQAKLDAGASLVQIYSGLVYHGPQLVADCVNATRLPDSDDEAAAASNDSAARG